MSGHSTIPVILTCVLLVACRTQQAQPTPIVPIIGQLPTAAPALSTATPAPTRSPVAMLNPTSAPPTSTPISELATPTGVTASPSPELPTTAPPAQTKPTEVGQPAGAAAPVSAAAQSPFKGEGRTALPPDISDQLARITGAGGLFAPTDVPPTVEVPSQIEITKGALVVFPGFDQVTPIVLTVTLPDRQVRSFQLPPEHPFVGIVSNAMALRYTPQVGDPLGVYSFDAIQGDRQASATTSVILATSPWITSSGEVFQQPFGPKQPMPAGSVFSFTLAGFSPGQLVELYLYRDYEAQDFPLNFRYLATLSPVTVDPRGETTFTLASQPDDPPGYYLIETRPKSNYAIGNDVPSDRYSGDGIFQLLPPS